MKHPTRANCFNIAVIICFLMAALWPSGVSATEPTIAKTRHRVLVAIPEAVGATFSVFEIAVGVGGGSLGSVFSGGTAAIPFGLLAAKGLGDLAVNVHNIRNILKYGKIPQYRSAAGWSARKIGEHLKLSEKQLSKMAIAGDISDVLITGGLSAGLLARDVLTFGEHVVGNGARQAITANAIKKNYYNNNLIYGTLFGEAAHTAMTPATFAGSAALR